MRWTDDKFDRHRPEHWIASNGEDALSNLKITNIPHDTTTTLHDHSQLDFLTLHKPHSGYTTNRAESAWVSALAPHYKGQAHCWFDLIYIAEWDVLKRD